MTGTGITTTPSRAATGWWTRMRPSCSPNTRPQTVINLERQGVAFSRTEDGHIAQRRFGGHTQRVRRRPRSSRAAYAADRIGHQILHALWQQCVADGVEFAEEWYVTDLVVSDDDGKQVEPASWPSTRTRARLSAIHARNVLLATGGAGPTVPHHVKFLGSDRRRHGA